MTVMATETVSVAERLENLLHPITSFVIVPIFALANAGVRITGDVLDAPGAAAVAGGVAVGLLVGKTVGIAGASALAVRLGLARLPDGLAWRQIVGVGAVAGIGFTVSLFIGGLAYDDPRLEDAARLAILATSAVAAVVGSAILALGSRSARAREPSAEPAACSEKGAADVDAEVWMRDARRWPRWGILRTMGVRRRTRPPRSRPSRSVRCPISSRP